MQTFSYTVYYFKNEVLQTAAISSNLYNFNYVSSSLEYFFCRQIITGDHLNERAAFQYYVVCSLSPTY